MPALEDLLVDDVSGAEVARAEQAVAGGAARLAVPPFARHVAALAERIE